MLHVEEYWRMGEDGEETSLVSARSYVANQIIAILASGVGPEVLDSKLADSGSDARVGRVLMRLSGGRSLVTIMTPSITIDAVSRLLDGVASSGVCVYAGTDDVGSACLVPDDSRYASQWGLRQIGAPAAWDVRTDASSVVVAVVDTGVKYDHPDLFGNMWRNPHPTKYDDGSMDIYGMACVNGRISGNPMDKKAGHGTHCAGIIGAVGGNETGISGVAWKVQIMALKCSDSLERFIASDEIVCLDYARSKGADIVNCSWGGTGYNPVMMAVLEELRAAGVIVVCAAGNLKASQSEYERDNDAVPFYPASYECDNIVSVAASTQTDGLAPFSHYGAESVDIAAPGVDILSTIVPAMSADGYYSWKGTSMAAPYVAGALALMKAHYPHDTHRQLIERIVNAGDVIPELEGKIRTGRRLNLAKAIGEVRVLPAPSVSASQGTVSNAVELTWAPVSGATHYRVYRAVFSSGASSAPDGGSLEPISGWQKTVGMRDDSAERGNVYGYCVKAAQSDEGAGESAFSAVAYGFVESEVLDQESSGANEDYGESAFAGPVVYPTPVMTILARVCVNGKKAGLGDELAAYVGDEVRARGRIDSDGLVTLGVRLAKNGESITFRLLTADAEDGDEAVIHKCIQTALGEIGGTLGSVADPYVLDVITNDPFGYPKASGTPPVRICANVLIGVEPAEEGDVLAAFSEGILVGKQRISTVFNTDGNKVAYCEMPVCVIGDGSVSFKLWDASEGVSRDSTNTFAVTQGIGIGTVENPVELVFDNSRFRQQTIHLARAGWHDISFAVLPDDASPEAIFAEVLTKVLEISTEDARWSPSAGGNIGELSAGVGYWIRTGTDDVTVPVTGYTRSDGVIQLREGWNHIGYPLDGEGRIARILETPIADGAIGRIVSANESWPGSMTVMTPGKGYWIYANKNYELRFNPYTLDAVSAPSATGGTSFGPLGTVDDIVSDGVCPTVFVDVPITLFGKKAAVEDCVVLVREDDGAIYALAKVLDESGCVTFPASVAAGTRLSFKIWNSASGMISPQVFRADNDCAIAAPEPGSLINDAFVEVSGDVPSYVVTFDLAGKAERIGGGDLVQEVYLGKYVSPPVIRTNLGYEFKCWDGLLTDIRSDKTITALYEDVSSRTNTRVRVWFELDEDPFYTNVTYTLGACYGSFPKLVKNGYRFLGWYTSEFGGVRICEDDVVSEDGLWLFPHWLRTPARWNDDFTNATTIAGGKGTVFGNNLAASSELGEPMHAEGNCATNSVWWKWKAPATCTMSFTTEGSTFDTGIDIYEGSELSSLSLVAQSRDSEYGQAARCEFNVVKGTTYFISVAGYAGSWGDIQLAWLPRNDGRGTVISKVDKKTGKTTMTAKAKKGSSFAYWTSLDGKIVSYSSSYKVATALAGQYKAVFRLNSTCMDLTLDGNNAFAIGGSNVQNAMVGIPLKDRFSVPDECWPVKFSVKGLPLGLKVNPSSGVISGIPRKAGKFTLVVTVKSVANPKKKIKVKVPMTIKPFPPYATGRFEGTICTDLNDLHKGAYASVTMTIGSTGKISGKFCLGKLSQNNVFVLEPGGTNWTFSADSFTADSYARIDKGWDYVYLVCSTTAKATVKSGKKKITLTKPIGFTMVYTEDLEWDQREDFNWNPAGCSFEDLYFDGLEFDMQRRGDIRVSKERCSTGSGTFVISPASGQASSKGKVTITAKPSPGSVLAYWTFDSYEIIGYDTTISVEPGYWFTDYVTAVFRRKEDFAFANPTPMLVDEDGLAITVEDAFSSLRRGVKFRKSVEIDEACRPVSFTATGLPKGLSINKTTGVISGVPRESVAKNVKITATCTGYPQRFASISGAVPPLIQTPAWAKGKFRGEMTVDGKKRKCVATVDANGKISCKAMFGKEAYSFTAPCFSEYDDASAYDDAHAEYCAKGTLKIKGRKYPIDIVIANVDGGQLYASIDLETILTNYTNGTHDYPDFVMEGEK